jgi:hypothetical protein
LAVGLVALAVSAAGRVWAGEADSAASARAARPESGLESLEGNSWLRLDPEGTAKARMYSGACFGGGRENR